MKGPGSINLLYNYLPDDRDQFSYRIIVCTGKDGPISDEILQKVFRERWRGPVTTTWGGVGPCFEGLSDLQQFSLMLLEELGLKHCYLLSKDGYNEGIRKVKEAAELPEMFSQYGDAITNHDLRSRQRPFLEKIMNKISL